MDFIILELTDVSLRTPPLWTHLSTDTVTELLIRIINGLQSRYH